MVTYYAMKRTTTSSSMIRHLCDSNIVTSLDVEVINQLSITNCWIVLETNAS